MYILVQSPGLPIVQVLKFSITGQVAQPLKLVLTKFVRLDPIESWAGELETFHAMYNPENDSIIIALKETNTANFQFKTLNVVDNDINIKATKIIKFFGDNNRKNLVIRYFSKTYCFSFDN